MRTTTHRKTRKSNRVARTERATAYRARFVGLNAKAARAERRALGVRREREAQEAEWAARPLVCDDTLTGDQRDALNEALREALYDHGGEVPYSGDIEVAYHAELPLSSASMLFGATDGESVDAVHAVLDQLGIRIDRERCDAEWLAYHDKWSVRCAECGTVSYGRPGGDIEELVTRGTWPDTCDCGAEIPKPHHTEIVGGDTAWWADCTCGWGKDADATTYKSNGAAKGQITRHLKAVEAARPVAA